MSARRRSGIRRPSGRPALPRAPSGVTQSAAGPGLQAEAAKSCTVRLTGSVAKMGGVELVVTNNGSRPVKACRVRVYAYDASGMQTGWGETFPGLMKSGGPNGGMFVDKAWPLAPGASWSGGALPAGGRAGNDYAQWGGPAGIAAPAGRSIAPNLTFEAVVPEVQFADSVWRDDAVAPEARPRGGR